MCTWQHGDCPVFFIYVIQRTPETNIRRTCTTAKPLAIPVPHKRAGSCSVSRLDDELLVEEVRRLCVRAAQQIRGCLREFGPEEQ